MNRTKNRTVLCVYKHDDSCSASLVAVPEGLAKNLDTLFYALYSILHTARPSLPATDCAHGKFEFSLRKPHDRRIVVEPGRSETLETWMEGARQTLKINYTSKPVNKQETSGPSNPWEGRAGRYPFCACTFCTFCTCMYTVYLNVQNAPCASRIHGTHAD